MFTIKIDSGKDILCLRFLNIGGFDCIQEHIDIISHKGFVWFGKIGNKPNLKILDKMIEDESNFILLKDQKRAFICEFEMYSEQKPDISEYPNYYTTEKLFDYTFTIWLKLISIKMIEDLEKLNQIVLKSSGNKLLEITKRSTSSFFYTYAVNDIYL